MFIKAGDEKIRNGLGFWKQQESPIEKDSDERFVLLNLCSFPNFSIREQKIEVLE